ncbi:hypothetical protein MUCCIDRAFT_106017 [Mucor lusitanicus CBS 277.49]|uniref:Uncharacterized protein n=1 Tax=Mucor lusitanicus CBS 277.49 TaxID=747725 RepID=A0A168QCG5_MUCCL|nr:hypothetical protein MUCCIDRAFT_106017 [Mucor lusitanicus CBS 277.49]
MSGGKFTVEGDTDGGLVLSEKDFEKLVNLMEDVYEDYRSNVIGILIIGEFIIVYTLIEESKYKCVIEISRCYFPVSGDDHSRLAKLYLTLTKTTKLIQYLIDNTFFSD